MKFIRFFQICLIACSALVASNTLMAQCPDGCTCGPNCACNPCLCGVNFPQVDGIWFPETTLLFKPFVADPRQVNYSVGWRFNDEIYDKKLIDVSFADDLILYQWYKLPYCWPGCLQIAVEGAVWALFSPTEESAPLINADYYVGVPIMYRYGNWSFRLRPFHISSHIGDEFLLMHPRFHRLNPSTEYIDFYASYDFCSDLRVYGGFLWMIRQDDSFHCSPLQAAVGMEARLSSFCCIDWCNRLQGTPFFGMHFRFSRDFKHHVDATYVLGYEWNNLCCLQRRVRIFLEYHDGYSVEGQFCKHPTNYLSLRLSYGF
jgi:hypothetical protein